MTKKQTNKPAIGTVLNNYRIISQIGAGGMGEVFLGEDARLERKVALKILPEDFAKDRGRMHRFVQEAKAASALNHPNIITIYEIGEVGKTHFIAAEHIEGETLRDYCERQSLTLSDALEIAIQIVSALQAAHAAGIVHRDIKPENIMIRPDGLVKILDFGIAKLTEKGSEGEREKGKLGEDEPTLAISPRLPISPSPHLSTTPGLIIGTAAYMSPEQARGKTIDARSDIFSFGVLFYELITGRQPFTGESAMDTISAILHQEVTPLHQLIPEIPPEIEGIIEKALKKDRDERYQTTQDLLIDLKDFKQELEFQNRLQHSSGSGSFSAPMGKSTSEPEAETQILKTAGTTGEAAAPEKLQTISATSAGGFGKYKLAALGVLVILLAAASYFTFFRSKSHKTIAVLPFVSAGDSNQENEYLSDGLSEKLIDNLSQIGQLKVIARSSSFKYRGENIDIQDAASKLRVDVILTGRLVRRADNLQINVELINTADNSRIWGGNFDRRLSEINNAPEEIAQTVFQKLGLNLTQVEQQQTAKQSTSNSEAFKIYLNGVYLRRKTGTEDVKKAIELQKQAIAIDPNFALAYAELSICYANLIEIGALDPKIATPQARAAAEKALALDEMLTDAHITLGRIKKNEFDWAGAEREFKRALEINPNNSGAHNIYASYLSHLGRPDEALREIRLAQEFDPLIIGLIGNEGIILYEARRYDEALPKSMTSVQSAGTLPNPYARLQLSNIYIGKGQYEAAIKELQTAIKMEEAPSIQIALGRVFALAGNRQEAAALLEKLKTTDKYVSPTELAVLYVALGDKEKAFELLEKGYTEHDLMLTTLKVEPGYDSIRNDPRFQDLLKRVGLPQ